ncbi:dimethylargininase [Kitasatospora sp. NPDC089913]|uniref:dimethylargininase n=1 Tax=Streptomycetaceae TaxID=2062 RepID=UPI00087C9E01|nr:dimethylargininase [Streptomyces sp. TLI_053]SDT04939.1 N-Dimethylarginine dimethylaminohydrolase [Streptomyces sp. TLI_053]
MPSYRIPERTAKPRRYLMCRPTYFTVEYAINPWMDPGQPTDTALAVRQWERLHELYRQLGHTVELIDPVPGLPDMVYTANGATVLDGRVLVASFRHPERAGESDAHESWFRARGYREVRRAERVNEGEGDHLVVGRRVLAGSGFRTDPAAHTEVRDLFGRQVLTLSLVDPRFYHLDTALAVLTDDQVMYYPEAFTPDSQALLRSLYPDAVLADLEDAEVFGLNAVSDGRRVLLPEAAKALAARLADEGFEPIPVDVSELFKGGGGPKCCTLELRP